METETVKTVKRTELPWFIAPYNKMAVISYHGPFGETAVSTIHHSDADAEFIVRACNSHYELLEALKSISEENYDDDDKKHHLHAIIDRVKSIANNVLEKSNLLTK